MSKQVNWLKRLQLLLKALEKNGVKTDVWVELETKISGYELDFTEHDKVFEDKIADLEGEITSLKTHMLRIRERCTDDARRHFENGTYGCLTVVNRNGDLEAENEKLKQRIAELEDKIGDRDEIKRRLFERAAELKSKESVKPMRIEFHADNGEPFTPLEVANSLINQNTFKVDELRELAEHLQVYCRHHNDKKEDVISF